MKRRQFLQYGTLATTSFTFAACQSQSKNPVTEPAVNFGKLEKTELQLGYVSGVDISPLIIALEKGIFKKYGLTVTLSRQKNWEDLEKALIDKKLDLVCTHFAHPLWLNLGKTKAEMVGLMGINLNGSGVVLSETLWKKGVRPNKYYNNFREFVKDYSRYIREVEKPPNFGISHPASMANYTTLYWLGAMGVSPDRDLKFQTLPLSDIHKKWKPANLDGYGGTDPYLQKIAVDQGGFIACLSKDIWQGHPDQILATMAPWLKSNPITAQSVMAAILEACRFCDLDTNRSLIGPIIANDKYFDRDLQGVISNSFAPNYNYGGVDKKSFKTDDFNIFNFRENGSLTKPNHANFIWHSHAAWVLTQMVRWRHLNLSDYPKDADKLIPKVYPVEPYQEVAKGLSIELPKERSKVEPAKVFIDELAFDPSKPIEYIGSFDVRS